MGIGNNRLRFQGTYDGDVFPHGDDVEGSRVGVTPRAGWPVLRPLGDHRQLTNLELQDDVKHLARSNVHLENR